MSMKIEQAIDLLDNLIGMIEDNQDNDYDTAFRMAIEALKAQLSCEGTTSDTISRQAAIDLCDWYDNPSMREDLEKLPGVQPEQAIPLSWIDEQIERLKGMDNAFATLTALQISGMVKKWRDEKK